MALVYPVLPDPDRDPRIPSIPGSTGEQRVQRDERGLRHGTRALWSQHRLRDVRIAGCTELRRRVGSDWAAAPPHRAAAQIFAASIATLSFLKYLVALCPHGRRVHLGIPDSQMKTALREPHEFMPASDGKWRILAADMNGDGKTDLVVANHSDGKISVLLGNGLGGFGAAAQYWFTDSGLQSIALVDFNREGPNHGSTYWLVT